MGLEFRQRGPAEYVQSLMRRKWLILLPALAIATAIAVAVMRLPSVYRSSALLVVKPSNVTVLQVTDPNEMTRKLNSLTQVVTSRTNVETLVKKYGLYKEERERGVSMDAIITKMTTKDIEVEMNIRNEVINGFTISYRGRDPRTAKAVTEELAGKCVEVSVSNDVNANERTRDFFDERLKTLQEQMDGMERERMAYLQQNINVLPTEQASLVEQLNGLRDQQKTLYSEIGRLRDQVSLQSTLLGAKREQLERERGRIDVDNVENFSSSQAYAEFIKQKTGLESELQTLLKTLRPKHPDVIAKQEQIANVEKLIEQERAREQQKIEARKKAMKAVLTEDSTETATIRANIQGLENERKRQEAILSQTEREITSINQRLASIPAVGVNLESINRRFTTAKAEYDAVAEKKQKASLTGAAITNNLGESIILQDAANLPQTPVAPKRPLLIALGLFLGLGVGLFFAMFAEAPRFFTIQTMDDAEHYTGLPVLVALPELMTPQESARRPRKRLAFLTVGVIISLISIPVIIKALSMTQIFERFVL
jgi:polysaccharide chain length determinant protein (PEP-CTERM system associated)